MKNKIKVGDFVKFSSADSKFKGIVVAMFFKSCRMHDEILFNGPVRIVVQNDDGILLIKNPDHAIKEST